MAALLQKLDAAEAIFGGCPASALRTNGRGSAFRVADRQRRFGAYWRYPQLGQKYTLAS
jgi:hypothetical protein